jgi:glyoxylase I family protein
MERVDGIGGFFFAAQDPEGLAGWYAERLGVDLPPASYDQQPWTQEAGPTIFAAFPVGQTDQPHLGPRGWGLNLRVRDLDAMVEQLRAAGVEVEVDPETYPNGRFANLADPEGNPLQLWQVAG